MKKQKTMYLGLEPVKIVGKRAEDEMVKVKHLSDVFNDSGTIVRKKGETRWTSADNVTAFPCPRTG